MYSKETKDVYSTNEPQNAFHVRIAFCLDTHNEAVKAMRYPPKKDKAAVAAARGSTDAKTALDLDDLDMDDDEMMGDFF